MDLDVLARLIGPPPRDTPPVDWTALQETLGLQLPDDFKSFAGAYGPIDLGEFLWVWSPAGAQARFDYGTHRWLRALRDADPASYPYTFWPEPGGLLMWGQSRLSHHFFWDTSASTDPRHWPTMLYSYLSPAPGMPGAGVYSGPSWRRIERSMTDIVAALVGGDSGSELGLDFTPLPARYGQDQRADGTQGRLGASGPPATPAPDAVERIAAALGVAGPARPPEWSGEQVPDDYRALIDRIGPGTLGGRLLLHAPGAPGGFEMATEHARAAATVGAPAAVHPEPGGLRLWGRFTTGETCWWVPAWYDADGWPVVICAADGMGWQRIDLTATGFIAEWLAGRMDLPVLALQALPANPSHRPATEQPPAPPPPSTRQRDPLAELATLLGPPDSDTIADWSTDERSLGTRLPADLKRLHAAYPELFFASISLLEPGQLVRYHDAISEFALDDRPAYPSPGGLLYCGGTENRDSLWWDTTDPDPDAWPVVVEIAGEFSPFPGNLTQLLVHTLTGRPPRLATGTVSAPPRRPR
ncbi:MAG TPA: SMI1/KNR4 family protein [Candidatus Limnocylindrales bacterium]|nr:SMI1/KNR4 family protein [Candidatus Limnocylindrales bacterium]